MLSSIFLLNEAGEVIAQMNFSESVAWRDLSTFWGHPLRFPVGEDGVLRCSASGTCSTFLRRNDVVVVATVREECLVAAIFSLLQNVVEVITDFLKAFSEEVLRDNFSTVHQILQEMLDFGYPLTRHLYELESLVSKPTLEHKVRQILDNEGGGNAQGGGKCGSSHHRTSLTDFAQTSAGGIGDRSASALRSGGVGASWSLAPWRDPRTHHHNNEVLFDVVERVDCVMSSDGKVAYAAVRGSIEVNCRLSGSPEVTVRLSNPEAMESIGLHYCVRAGRYETDRTLSFIPPDGRFTLCQYTIRPTSVDAVHPSLVPFYVTPQLFLHEPVGEGGGEIRSGSFSCMVGWRGGGAPLHGPNEVRDLTVRLRLPQGTDHIHVDNCNRGHHRFSPRSEVLSWTIDALGRTPPSLSGTFTMRESTYPRTITRTRGSVKESKPTAGFPSHSMGGGRSGISAQLEFEIANYTLSRVGVSSVQVTNTAQKFYKGVKYTTRAGDFVIRSS